MMIDAALELFAGGWRPFPCAPRGPRAKAPLTEHGHLDAPRTREEVAALFTRHPDAMIGAPVPDSLLVLDVDPRNGGSVAVLEALVGPLPPTLTVWSGRNDGGRHLYWLRPAGEFTQTRLPAGVDLKVNGYCILPPSLHPATGEPYRWGSHPFAPLPPRLRELLRPVTLVTDVTLLRRGGRSGEPLIRLVSGLRDGERNRGLFWAACRAAERGLQIDDALVSAATAAGLSEGEARRVVRSAAKQVGRAM